MKAPNRIQLACALTLLAAACGGGSSTDFMPAPDPASLASESVAQISNGGEVDIAPYLVAGKRTVVEFGAVW